MFSDNKKPRTMNEIGAQPNRISKHTKIKGDIISEADFRIDGKLDGNVKTTGKVVIGKDGYIHGKVECVNADIEGSFNGELLVSDLLFFFGNLRRPPPSPLTFSRRAGSPRSVKP